MAILLFHVISNFSFPRVFPFFLFSAKLYPVDHSVSSQPVDWAFFQIAKLDVLYRIWGEEEIQSVCVREAIWLAAIAGPVGLFVHCYSLVRSPDRLICTAITLSLCLSFGCDFFCSRNYGASHSLLATFSRSLTS